MYVCLCVFAHPALAHSRTAVSAPSVYSRNNTHIHTFVTYWKNKKKKQPNQTHAHIRIQNTQELNICNVDTGQSRAGVPDYNESWLGRFSSLHFSLSLTHSLNMCMCAVIVVVIAECRVFFFISGYPSQKQTHREREPRVIIDNIANDSHSVNITANICVFASRFSLHFV